MGEAAEPTAPRRARPASVARKVALWALVVVLVALSRPTPATVTAGFVVAAAGELLRAWAAGHLRKTVELVTSGPYRYTRNPLYLGRLLIFTGLCLMAPLPYSLHWAVLAAGYGLFFGYYLPRKERVEPARLFEAHGDEYARYHDAVPALLPGRSPYPERPGAGWSSDRFIANREHWMVLGLLLVTLLLLYRAYRLGAI